MYIGSILFLAVDNKSLCRALPLQKRYFLAHPLVHALNRILLITVVFQPAYGFAHRAELLGSDLSLPNHASHSTAFRLPFHLGSASVHVLEMFHECGTGCRKSHRAKGFQALDDALTSFRYLPF